MMVALDRIFELSAKNGVQDVVIGMPHRGRLNLLCDLLKYPYAGLFHKMKGNSELPEGVFASGDVISHLVNNPDLEYAGKKVHVSLLSNPSHLEAINPVAMGKARAKQTELLASSESNCNLGDRVMCVQIHGDAVSTLSIFIYLMNVRYKVLIMFKIGICWSRCSHGISRYVQLGSLLFWWLCPHCRQ